MRKAGSGNNRWSDHYTRRARRDNYPARSVYKLQEMQDRYRLIRRGDRVLDLGCAPGSWLLFAAAAAGSGQVVGIDLEPVKIRLPANAAADVGDGLAETEALLAKVGRGFQVVLSDMAPATTGQKSVDAARSHGLCLAALRFADETLQAGGNFACKIFQGAEFAGFSEAVKERFKVRKIYKPRSSRKASKEIYIIGIGKT